MFRGPSRAAPAPATPFRPRPSHWADVLSKLLGPTSMDSENHSANVWVRLSVFHLLTTRLCTRTLLECRGLLRLSSGPEPICSTYEPDPLVFGTVSHRSMALLDFRQGGSRTQSGIGIHSRG